ncbi:MAG: methionyl-tRNA formyltransferase [Kiritimatiellae bacterium]|jgi:methionyl-tRNA formyltransferase|nr:methionyl-tRNA formyltransferase [Kiritimatiellia bacterium]
MKILFMGTPEIAAESLKTIIDADNFDIVGVVTQPDRPFGRKLKMMPLAVKVLALENDLEVLTPENVNTAESIEQIRALNPDIIVVVAYGQIIKPAILDIPKFGCINLHTSLLPKYRGAAPIQRAVLAGDTVSGATVMYMNEKMDDGDIISQVEVPIGPNDTASILHDNLSREGSKLLVETLSKIFNGTNERIPQNKSDVTFAAKLQKSDGLIDWSKPSQEVHNQIRGMNSWPVCFVKCVINGKEQNLKIWNSLRVTCYENGAVPGTVIDFTQHGSPIVQTGAGCVSLEIVQPEGKKKMDSAAFVRGYRIDKNFYFGVQS